MKYGIRCKSIQKDDPNNNKFYHNPNNQWIKINDWWEKWCDIKRTDGTYDIYSYDNLNDAYRQLITWHSDEIYSYSVEEIKE